MCSQLVSPSVCLSVCLSACLHDLSIFRSVCLLVRLTLLLVTNTSPTVEELDDIREIHLVVKDYVPTSRQDDELQLLFEIQLGRS